jgi:hypothetical protein
MKSWKDGDQIPEESNQPSNTSLLSSMSPKIEKGLITDIFF